MSDPYIGEIKIWAFAWAPRGWALCDGSVLQIRQNQALFAVIGNNFFGGDGSNTFALPDLRGRTPVGVGTSVFDTTTSYTIGKSGGQETVTLNASSVPGHTHALYAVPNASTAPFPAGNMMANVVTSRSGGSSTDFSVFLPSQSWTADASLNAGSVSTAGASAPHNNLQPYTVVNFTICTIGSFPPHSN